MLVIGSHHAPLHRALVPLRLALSPSPSHVAAAKPTPDVVEAAAKPTLDVAYAVAKPTLAMADTETKPSPDAVKAEGAASTTSANENADEDVYLTSPEVEEVSQIE